MTAADTLRHAAVWIDGDPLMEAIAAAVYEQCGTHPEQSLTVDDPRNIATVAATVARQLLGTGEQAEAETAPDADRAATLRERADYFEGVLRNVADPSSDPRYWSAISDVVMGLRRLADEAQQPTPAVAPPEPLTDGGRQFLAYALHLADDQMASRSDEFSDDDRAALATLQRLAKAGCTCGNVTDEWIEMPHTVGCPATPAAAEEATR